MRSDARANFLAALGSLSSIRGVINPAGMPEADAPLSMTPTGAGRSLLNGAIFLAACIGMCALLGHLAPFPEVPGIYPKWAHFKKHRDDYNVLFLGSSRFYHQIIPPQFDTAVGGGTRSFNFGYDGMWPPESFYLLREVLELRPAHLKWVVIDLMDINTQLDERNNSTLRMAYWHDWKHTSLALRDILDTARSDRWSIAMQHARLWFQQAANVGRGAELLEPLLTPRNARKRPYSWEARAGFEAGPDRGMTGDLRKGFEETVNRLLEKLPPSPVRPIFREALSELIADVRRAGAEPIFVVAPTINGRENFEGVPDGATVFHLNRPAEYPILFDPDLHYDAWHLNERGAVHLTEQLAKMFSERTKR